MHASDKQVLWWFVSKANLSTKNTSSGLGRTEYGLSTLWAVQIFSRHTSGCLRKALTIDLYE